MTLEVVQFRKGANDKWHVTRLGGARKNDKSGIDVFLNALPLPDERGMVKLVIQQRQEQEQRNDPARQAPSQDDFSDGIPF